ncbi:hypothetical protein N8T08_009097 [Aspergillus melleus]|uniref:Uncharacterized protein n=1 Tax=Aspergillus melleus TaxID=138277 RepID=A0ACC3AVJ6_9EURO|nr:hypothetical protein N8T08_009097 [Aspergillus melleus]
MDSKQGGEHPNDKTSPDSRPDESLPEASSRALASQSPSAGAIQPEKPRKPPVTRRMSSKRQVPHKGQEFSTEDDVQEVEEDIAMQQATHPQPSPRTRPLRKQNSTIRRRVNPRVTTPLTRTEVDSDNGKVDESGLPDSSLEQSGPDNTRQPDPSSGGEDDYGGGGDDDDDNDQDHDHHDGDGDGDGDDDDDASNSEENSKDNDDDAESTSDAESFTLKDRQQAINETHPFGIRIWKPALYKKSRSVEKTAEGDIHSSPGGRVGNLLLLTNLLWTVFFGWWLALAALTGAVACFIFAYYSSSAVEYGRVFSGLSWYLIYPFGSFVRLDTDENYAEEDEGEGRSISRVVFFIFFYFLVGPLMLLVSLLCWLLVFWIPMGRVTVILFDHLRRHPLALSYHSDSSSTRHGPGSASSVLLCTYRAAGLRYWKYTVGGTNIFLINLLGVVLFVIVDYFLLSQTLGIQNALTHPGLIFTLALVSIIPLAYFIGQAVASISAQSSMGMGAAVNAFFSTVVEVYLYCVALTEGKGQLVEGSIIGSIFAGVLFLPGLSMCFGAIKRKTQRFNVKSAGVTSTMLMFAVIAAFGPTLFYQIYGSHELNCRPCFVGVESSSSDCRRCYFSQIPAVNDSFFRIAVQPYSWFAALFLFLSYIIGLWFTLRTHAALIWATEAEEKKAVALANEQQTTQYDSRHLLFHNGSSALASGGSIGPKGSVRDSQLYKRILGQSLKHVGLSDIAAESTTDHQSEPSFRRKNKGTTTPYLVPPLAQDDEDDDSGFKNFGVLSGKDNERLVRQVTEVAATAAAVAARDVARTRKPSVQHSTPRQDSKSPADPVKAVLEEHDDIGLEHGHTSGGHDAPNWSRARSSIILLVATVLYAIIAEILVNTVDVVLESVDIDEKFLGITLFALVPNTTEFLNAISFAMHGNIALSMEIGSAYVLQVCLLQIPALVLFSAIYAQLIEPTELLTRSFNNMDTMGIDRFDTLALGSETSEKFYTIGRSRSGRAY